jgi:SRSO17 transposase
VTTSAAKAQPGGIFRILRRACLMWRAGAPRSRNLRAFGSARASSPDPERCQTVGVPHQIGFATKPALAAQMLTRALDAGVPAAWVAGDEVYGANPGLRAELEARGVGYVLAVACDHRVRAGGATHRAYALLKHIPARAWQQVSCGKGAKGHRLYDWAFIRLDHDDSAPGDAPGDQAGQHWLLVRRNHKTGELAFYRCSTPRPVPLATLVRVAGIRWTVEERFQTGKGLVGLDQHQVRRWRSWYRWVTWPCSPTPSWSWRP